MVVKLRLPLGIIQKDRLHGSRSAFRAALEWHSADGRVDGSGFRWFGYRNQRVRHYRPCDVLLRQCHGHPQNSSLVFLDTDKPDTAARTLAAIRRWDDSPVHTVIYTHGHIDHTSGIAPGRRGRARGVARPHIIAHRNVLRRLSRYEMSHGFNSIVQGQQFNYPNYVLPIGNAVPTRFTTPSR
jgi:glyoxylase-like metal-dependent hydrolase (beta-lactamase superfamily II)